ncbi:MAG: FTR1 family protein [Chloroflexota bacterium]
MLAGFLLALREGLEAALVIGMVLGILGKLKRPDLNRMVWGGVVLAFVLSTLIGVVLTWLGLEFAGPGEMIFEGLAMLLAAGVLTWMIVWVNQTTRGMKDEIEAKTHQALREQRGSGLFALAFLAVFREGVELALFLLAVEKASSPLQTLLGAVTGLLSALLLGWFLFSSTYKLNLRKFFGVTNILLIIFAAGMLASGVHEFIELGWIPAIIDPLWNISSFLSNSSELGQLLKALVGYTATPTLVEVLVYVAYIAGIYFYSYSRKQAQASVMAGAAN